MPKMPLYDQTGKVIGETELSSEVFEYEDRPGLVYQVVVSQRSNLRQGTRLLKNRAMVSGGGRKPYRQKGTGRARQGTIRAPHWVGGGRTFGGQVQNHDRKISRKMRRNALKSVLSQKVRDEQIKVVDAIRLDGIKTRQVAAVLKALEFGRGTLLVYQSDDQIVYLSSRNIDGVKTIRVDDLSTLDGFEAKQILIDQASVQSLTERLSA